MFTKSIVMAVAILFAQQAIAMPAPEPAEVEARNSGNVGVVLLYPNTGGSGSYKQIQVGQGATSFCEEWVDIDTNKQLFEVKSYFGSNIGCFTFAQSGCQGDSNGAIGVSLFKTSNC